MSGSDIDSAHATFESIRRTSPAGVEYWSARDLAKVLDYSEYRHFLPAVEKAKLACINSGHKAQNHFEEILEMVPIGSGAQRETLTYHLSRYACYLIIQNADPSKKIVAAGQTYFAMQTRKQELAEQELAALDENEKRLLLREEMKAHNKKLAGAAKDAGVITGFDFALFQDHGYRGLYGGLGNKDIHQHKGLKAGEQILDHMGSTELAANLFRATQTEEKLRREQVKGKQKANQTHHEVGVKVRQTIKELGGAMPEHLPSAESIKKIARHARARLVKLTEE